MMKTLSKVGALVAVGGLLSVAGVAPAAAQSATPTNYANPTNWLCLPGRADACSVDLSSTSVSTSGGLRTKTFRAASNPKIDCFYVYPTVSLDSGAISDLIPGPEERRVVAAQFARFASACRTFAPLYRQVTATALRDALETGESRPRNVQPTGYGDVLAAWRHYLTYDNGGRGVVLIGHGQGAELLMRLIGEEIEERPAQGRLVSAILVGATVRTAAGRDTGGTFRTIPLCRAQNQTGCVISYSSYRDSAPPTDQAWYGRNGEGGDVAACVNPANLRSGRGTADSYFSTIVRSHPLMNDTPLWAGVEKPVGTPFVQTPRLISTSCVSDSRGSWLSVHINARSDRRADDIYGDLTVRRRIQAEAGLHWVDMELSLGDLIETVQRQGRAYKPPRG